jgi:hypothetical protein
MSVLFIAHGNNAVVAATWLSLFMVNSAAGQAPGASDSLGWHSLFDGRTLQGWKVTDFGGQGSVRVEPDGIVLDFGDDLTGITCTQQVPLFDYEVTVEAMRAGGRDFFCGLTFPVGDSCCTLIVGGWGGYLVGVSSIDGGDASDNETTQSMDFDENRWYRVRVRVAGGKIQAWIDDKQVVDLAIAGREFSVRSEVSLSRPLGIASWRTKAVLRDIRLRRLSPGPETRPPSQ